MREMLILSMHAETTEIVFPCLFVQCGTNNGEIQIWKATQSFQSGSIPHKLGGCKLYSNVVVFIIFVQLLLHLQYTAFGEQCSRFYTNVFVIWPLVIYWFSRNWIEFVFCKQWVYSNKLQLQLQPKLCCKCWKSNLPSKYSLMVLQGNLKSK